MKRVLIGLVAVAGVLLFAGGAWAIDVGAPGLVPQKAGTFNVEVFYESYERDISQDVPRQLQWGVPPALVNDNFQQEENRYVARVSYAATDQLMFRVDLGMSDPEAATDNVPIFGAGVSYLALKDSLVDVTLFASGHYVSGIKYDNEAEVTQWQDGAVTQTWESPKGTQDESYLELAGGVLVSKNLQVVEAFMLQPYAGVQLSMLRGDEEYDQTFQTLPFGRQQFEGDIEEDGIFAVVAGLRACFNERMGLRFEGRFINQTSYSIGAFYAF